MAKIDDGVEGFVGLTLAGSGLRAASEDAAASAKAYIVACVREREAGHYRSMAAIARINSILRAALEAARRPHHKDCPAAIPEGMCECGDPLDKHTGAWGNGGAGWLPKACNIGGGMARCECTYPIPAGACDCGTSEHNARIDAVLYPTPVESAP